MKQHHNSIFIPLESYLYLHEQHIAQRSGRIMSDKMRQHLVNNFNNFCWKSNGMYNAMDGYLGGAFGPPENSYEEGRWTSWSVQDMKRMLDAAGLPWEDGPVIESISVGLW